MDTTGQRSSACAVGEARTGHNRCTEILYNYAKTVDHEAEMEPRDLVPTQGRLRPADLLTTAGGRLTAADLGVTSPAVAASAEEAMEAMFARKKKGACGNWTRTGSPGHQVHPHGSQPLWSPASNLGSHFPQSKPKKLVTLIFLFRSHSPCVNMLQKFKHSLLWRPQAIEGPHKTLLAVIVIVWTTLKSDQMTYFGYHLLKSLEAFRHSANFERNLSDFESDTSSRNARY